MEIKPVGFLLFFALISLGRVSGAYWKLCVHLRVVVPIGDNQVLPRKWGMGSPLGVKVKNEQL